MRDIYLILENKTVFKGKSFGAYKEALGEVVFTTSMVGYIEALTDPCNYGKIIVQTFPQIGNYGVMSEDKAGEKIYASAYVVREKCDNPSNFRCEETLESFMEREGLPGIYGIDTRKLTKIIREEGVMNGKLSFTPEFSDDIAGCKTADAVKAVSGKDEKIYKAENAKKTVVLFDFGAVKPIVEELLKRNINVIKVPYFTTADRIKELKPDGIVLSDGPGNPSENTDTINNLKEIIKLNIPIFGISLGHQLLAMAQGAEVEKLKYGHRGSSQPVYSKLTKKVFVTSQNHDYFVKSETLPKNAEVIYINKNDNSCEGIEYKDISAFSVQFSPEIGGDLSDSKLTYDKFVKLMEV